MRSTHHGTHTQFQLLVEHMPDVAKVTWASFKTKIVISSYYVP